jgi:hypothetical protein
MRNLVDPIEVEKKAKQSSNNKSKKKGEVEKEEEWSEVGWMVKTWGEGRFVFPSWTLGIDLDHSL